MPNYTELQELARQIAESPLGKIGVVQYDCPGGVICGYGILTVPPGDGDFEHGGAVQYCPMAAGDAFPPHMQEYNTEWLIVINGQLEVQTEGETALLLTPGDGLRIRPGVLHTARAISDCLVVGITVPRDGGYPDGPRPERHAGGLSAGDNGDGG